MKTVEQCWLKNRCKKTCPSFCIKLFKLDFLYNEALITDFQRKHIDLRLDEDGTDKDNFIKLKDIESNILDFINNGKNLYLHSQNTGNGKTS